MSDFVEVKTCDLIGSALDWAVGEAIGEKNHIDSRFIDNEQGNAKLVFWCWNSYSTEWANGGPLIDKYRPQIGAIEVLHEVRVIWGGVIAFGYDQSSVLPALCRAIVASTLGDQVAIPAELVK